MMSEILKSAELWTLVADIAASAVLYFGAKYLVPSAFEDVQFIVIAVFQPITALVLGVLFKDRAERNITAMLAGKPGIDALERSVDQVEEIVGAMRRR